MRKSCAILCNRIDTRSRRFQRARRESSLPGGATPGLVSQPQGQPDGHGDDRGGILGMPPAASPHLLSAQRSGRKASKSSLASRRSRRGPATATSRPSSSSGPEEHGRSESSRGIRHRRLRIFEARPRAVAHASVTNGVVRHCNSLTLALSDDILESGIRNAQTLLDRGNL
jgi:hypothetical protein